MTETTFDSIRRCPICNELGQLDHVQPYRDKSETHYFVCVNKQCRWFEGAPWMRDRHPDGTWVTEAKRRTKQFSNLPDRTEEIQQSIDAQLRAEMGR